MDEFYKILGVNENSTDEEIKKAYIDLKRKYDPDDEVNENATDEEIKNLKRKYDPASYEKESLKKYAKDKIENIEKTRQIMEAFAVIMNEKRTKRMQNKDKSRTGEDGQYSGTYGKNLEVVQELIEQGNIVKADELLMSFKNEDRTAGWYYLKGIVLYKKGWILESSNFFETAVRMDPSNEDYKKALEKINWQKRGNFGGPQGGGFGESYPNPVPFGCSFCDICGGILCMDFCCNCGMPRGYGRCC